MSENAAQERRRLEEAEERRAAEHAARLAEYQARVGVDARDDYVLQRVEQQTRSQIEEALEERRLEELAAGTDSTIPWGKLIVVSLLVCGFLLAVILAGGFLDAR